MTTAGWALLCLWIIVASSTIAWSALDCRPPGWDQGGHLIAAVDYAHAVVAGPRALRRSLASSHSYPPLYHFILAAVFATFGVFSWVPALVNSLFAGIMVYAVWRLGRQTYPEDPLIAFTATALAVTSPFLAYTSHQALLDYALTALVALAVMVVVREDLLSHTAVAAAAGAAVAAALLVKPTAAIFLAGPLLLAVGPAVIAGDNDRRRRLLVFLVCASLPALAWYAPHRHDVTALLSTNLADAAREGDPPSLSWAGVYYYVHGFYRLDFSPVLALALVPGMLWALGHWRRTRYLWAWVIPGWLALTFLMANKDYRYALPLLPGVALLGAGGLLWLPRGPVRVGISALGLGLAGIYYSHSLFDAPALSSRLLAPLARPAVALHVPVDARPRCEDWKQDEIVDALARAIREKPSGRSSIGVVPSSRTFNPSGIRYRLVLRRLPADVVGFEQTEDWRAMVDGIDVLVTKSGDQGLEHVTQFNRAINAYVATRPDLFGSILTVPLPDGSEARVYERTRRSPSSAGPSREVE